MILYTTFFILFLGDAYGQTKEELEARKRNTQLEIENTNSMLQETQQSREATVNKVRILNTRIELRKELINSYNSEI